MKYKITIDEEIGEETKQYPTYREVYKQITEDIDVSTLVKTINESPKINDRLHRAPGAPQLVPVQRRPHDQYEQ